MKAYKYRIYPNQKQRDLFEKHFSCTRFVYNWGLGLKKDLYNDLGENLSRSDMQKLLVSSKKADKPWLAEVNSQSLLASMLNLDKAFSNFFKGISKFPKFKKKSSGYHSFQCPQHVTVDFINGVINLPKIKGIKIKLHRGFDGDIKTVTIKKTPTGKYFASVLVDSKESLPIKTPVEKDKTLGIDLGINYFIIPSEGEPENNPRFLRVGLEKLAIEQKKLSRCKLGSNNRSKQKINVARVHEKITNQRLNFAHKITSKLINLDFTSYALEDLNVKGMIKNRKLAKSISDVAWGMFTDILSYKCDWNGKNYLKINRFQPSSKTCNCCGYKLEKLGRGVTEWVCPECKSINNRDKNAAKNIRDFALADALGLNSACVKSSCTPIPVSAGGVSKGSGLNLNGSQEAQAIAAHAV